MNLSKKWLSDYVNLDGITDKQFSDEMTLSGSKVETFETEGAELENIVVGKILSLEKHPDSDHLWICSVDVGQESPLQIVTGAQNLKVGDFVPAALNNSVVFGGKKIKNGKLRGVESFGMLCSLGELGLTQRDFPDAIEDGIFVLGDECDHTLGMDIKEAIGLNDVVTEFEITSNRSDCLSITGLAREAAATFNRPLTIKEPVVKAGHGNVNDMLKVTIEDDRCYRYCGAVVENVRVKPSPRWIRERLRACGVRPINNIVDITNYVMLEFGQPMHAFDIRYLDNSEVIVRAAKKGEKITTLDDIERELDETMLIIADANKPVAVAGVMGGEFSGIMDDTNTIVFESACFNGASVRRTAKKLGLRTEASSRYEKELNPKGCVLSLMRALELVEMLDAGDVVNGYVDCSKVEKPDVQLKLDYKWINNFIGIDLSEQEQIDILKKIDFKVENGVITAPYFRNDIEHMADIAEEVARFYGYQNIPNKQLGGVANGKLTDVQKLQRTVNETLLGCGLTEISTYSFISPKAYDKIELPKNSPLRECVVISNPLGEDTSVMRTTAVPTILDVLSRNYNYRNQSAELFEIATTYKSNGTEELPDENQVITIGMYGKDYDFFTIKGIVEELLLKVGVKNYDIEALKDNPTYHPGRTAIITVDGKKLATVGEIHPQVLENYSIGVKAYVAEIDFDVLFENRMTQLFYKPLPKFPASTRDLAFVCDKSIPVLTLEKSIGEAVGKILEQISLFDVYEGSQIEDGKKSVAFSIRMRSADKTLTDEEADAAMKRAIKALDKLGISLRS
ncbi:MAG: phenylalanine--tRNA ligase subunit beta [Clostridiales bacterium]|nr:phenylalanine--tRNA ligase subunit beta [Clostridiales bacterium]